MGALTRVVGAALVLVVLGCTAPDGTRSAPGGPAPAQPTAGPKRIAIGIRGDPKTLSAKLNSAAGAGGVPGVSETETLLNAGLAIQDSTDALHAQLAEAVPSVENGLWVVYPDGTMQTTWKIRSGAAWHDGTPFTSADLLFTASVEQDAELPIFRNVAYSSVDRVEAPDTQTITIHWKRPFIEADTMFTNARALPLPRHLLEKTYTTDKEDFVNLPYWNREFVGTGPFKLREWEAGTHVILDANDAFVLGRPQIDQIEVKFIPDP